MSARRPEQVLQFGTGMLLRGLCDACVDTASRAGRFDGGIVVVQSTSTGNAGLLNAQRGAYTLVERGHEGGRRVERMRRIRAITRALRIDPDWGEVCGVAASPDLRVIISNVTEAGFRSERFHMRLTAVLYERYQRLGAAAPRLLVIPTELVERNGDALAKHVAAVAGTYRDAETFAQWIGNHVRFCSSLVDRIVTGTPKLEERVELEARLGYRDDLITLCEPYRLWAIEGDPAELRALFRIDGPDSGVVFAPSIGPLRERKVRLLNGAHTALAPLALLAGVETVRDAAEHELLGPFLEHVLLREIAPTMRPSEQDATSFARGVIERFRNPWLHHTWRVIANDQAVKFRERVVPSIVGYATRFGCAPPALLLSLAAHLHFIDSNTSAARSLGHEALWGTNLAAIPRLTAEVTRLLNLLVHNGWRAALEGLDLCHE